MSLTKFLDLPDEDTFTEAGAELETIDDNVVPGAPIEKINPLGRHVTLLSAVMLNVGQLIGSGIFSVPGTILKSVGSVGMLFTFWILAPIFAFAGLLLYSELASMFPNRSGAEVVYVEQAYPRPRFLVPIAFAVTAVILSHVAANAIVFAQYSLTAFDYPITAANQSIVAIGVTAVTVLAVGASTKWSLRVVNFLSVLKIISLAFIIGTGVAVLIGLTSISDPFSNFHNLFDGTVNNPNSLATGMVKANYAFIGWSNAFNVLSEIKSTDPVRTVRKAALISLSLVCVLFLFTNIAYVAVVPREEIRNSGQLVAALFFRHVFATALPLMVACSCFGNLIAVTVGRARMLREIARQGLLPYPQFFSSTAPFGTPLAPASIVFFLTVAVIAVLPAKDAFNFLLDVASYPHLIFACALASGVWVLRARRARAGVSPSAFAAHNAVIALYLTSCVFLLVMPWVPPEPGHADVSFWYATYCVAGIALLLLCGLYYWVWIIVLPRLGGYKIVVQVEEAADGARSTRLLRRYQAPEAQALLDS